MLIPICLFSQTQKIEINTNNEFSQIYINNKFIGEGAASIDLEPGTYYLEIIEGKRIYNPQRILDTIYVKANSRDIFEYNFDKKIMITTNPPDAEIIYDSTTIGRTPLAFIPKAREYKISKNGYTSKIFITDELKPATNFDLEYTGSPQSPKFIDTFWFKALFGSAITFGASAAYFKMKADDSYDKYLETKNRGHLDDTDRYDVFSAAAFALLQINFGVLIYLFVFD